MIIILCLLYAAIGVLQFARAYRTDYLASEYKWWELLPTAAHTVCFWLVYEVWAKIKSINTRGF